MKTINFSGNILNKVHLHHNLCNLFCTISLGSIYPSVWTLLTNVCYKKKVQNDFESSSTHSASTVLLTLGGHSVSCTVPRTTIATQKQYHLAQVEHVNESLDSFHNGSHWFGVSVDLKCKIYDLGPLQDCYPARRRPT